jgi:hypothetical protein
VRIRQVQSRKNHHRVKIVSDALPFGQLWYSKSQMLTGYAKFYSRSHDVVSAFYNAAGNMSETRAISENRALDERS